MIEAPKLPEPLKESCELERLASQAILDEETLSGFHFKNAAIAGPQAPGIEFQGCIFENCRLSGCDFRGA